jgi:hypothetical protein
MSQISIISLAKPQSRKAAKPQSPPRKSFASLRLCEHLTPLRDHESEKDCRIYSTDRDQPNEFGPTGVPPNINVLGVKFFKRD